MPELPKEQLLNRIENAILLSGWQPYVERRSHPFHIRAGQGTLFRNLHIYIWTLTPGGPTPYRPAGEFRIQLTGVPSPLLALPGFQELLMGWHEESSTFAAFDFRRHRNFGRSPSIQVRLDALEDAATHGFAFRRRGNNELVICFVPDQFMNYVTNQNAFHRFAGHPDELEILEAARQTQPAVEDTQEMPFDRQEVVNAVHRWVRERSFRNRILEAYAHRCAICQLQLQLVEAAHIVPVHVPGSTDSIDNGLSLCPTHHAAYDVALLTVRPDYHVVVSEVRLNELRNSNLHGGESSVLRYVCNTIWVPPSPAEQPRPDYLEIGMRVRGWRE